MSPWWLVPKFTASNWRKLALCKSLPAFAFQLPRPATLCVEPFKNLIRWKATTSLILSVLLSWVKNILFVKQWIHELMIGEKISLFLKVSPAFVVFMLFLLLLSPATIPQLTCASRTSLWWREPPGTSPRTLRISKVDQIKLNIGSVGLVS